MTNVSTNTDVILVNIMLTFLQYGLNTATVQNVLKVASSTFSMKEVKQLFLCYGRVAIWEMFLIYVVPITGHNIMHILRS